MADDSKLVTIHYNDANPGGRHLTQENRTITLDSKDEARNILPPLYRRQATIVQLSKFGLNELDDLIKLHEGR